MASEGGGGGSGPGGGVDSNLLTQAKLARSALVAQYLRELIPELRIQIYKKLMPTDASLALSTYLNDDDRVGYFTDPPGDLLTVGNPALIAEFLHEMIKVKGTLLWRAHNAFELNWHKDWLRASQVDKKLVKKLQVMSDSAAPNVPPTPASASESSNTSQPPMRIEDAFMGLISELSELLYINIHSGPGGMYEWWTPAGTPIDLSDTATATHAVAGRAKFRTVMQAISRVTTLQGLVFYGEFDQRVYHNLPRSYPHLRVARKAAQILQEFGRGDVKVQAVYSIRCADGGMGWRLS